jgi:hexosaminidase
MRHINQTSTDPYIHFGGDEISESCYSQRPSIMEWMKAHGMSNYTQLSIYYRQRQKTLWRNISKTTKAIYWADDHIDMPVDQDDVIQWWGQSTSWTKLVGRKTEVILSYVDQLYLDIGFGSRTGGDFRTMISWRDIYKF